METIAIIVIIIIIAAGYYYYQQQQAVPVGSPTAAPDASASPATAPDASASSSTPTPDASASGSPTPDSSAPPTPDASGGSAPMPDASSSSAPPAPDSSTGNLASNLASSSAPPPSPITTPSGPSSTPGQFALQGQTGHRSWFGVATASPTITTPAAVLTSTTPATPIGATASVVMVPSVNLTTGQPSAAGVILSTSPSANVAAAQLAATQSTVNAGALPTGVTHGQCVNCAITKMPHRILGQNVVAQLALAAKTAEYFGQAKPIKPQRHVTELSNVSERFGQIGKK